MDSASERQELSHHGVDVMRDMNQVEVDINDIIKTIIRPASSNNDIRIIRPNQVCTEYPKPKMFQFMWYVEWMPKSNNGETHRLLVLYPSYEKDHHTKDEYVITTYHGDVCIKLKKHTNKGWHAHLENMYYTDNIRKNGTPPRAIRNLLQGAKTKSVLNYAHRRKDNVPLSLLCMVQGTTEFYNEMEPDPICEDISKTFHAHFPDYTDIKNINGLKTRLKTLDGYYLHRGSKSRAKAMLRASSLPRMHTRYHQSGPWRYRSRGNWPQANYKFRWS